MSTEEFANVGVFVTAFVGYLLGTALFGYLGSEWGTEDDVFFGLSVAVWSDYLRHCSHGHEGVTECLD